MNDDDEVVDSAQSCPVDEQRYWLVFGVVLLPNVVSQWRKLSIPLPLPLPQTWWIRPQAVVDEEVLLDSRDEIDGRNPTFVTTHDLLG
jgi:hypothetical protein